jgi:hypothetical protein
MNNGSFSRKNQEGVRWGVKLKDATATWPTPDMEQGNTEQNWGTPNTLDYLPPRSYEAMKKQARNGARKNRNHPGNLREQIHPLMHQAYQEAKEEVATNWPTPTTAEAGKISNNANYGQMGLSNHPAIVGKPDRVPMKKSRAGDGQKTTKTKNWPTPVSRDRLGMDSSGKKNPHKPPELYHSILPAQPNTKDGHDCSLSCRRLSPLFAEMLMGLPLGWTNDSEPLEMELFRQWQLMLGHILIERMSYES